ncbi:polysaccharide deacetylase family protein [Endozoicomonas lisbonensis]|uniref:DUF7033 domain-containing protein n=1 Tax=Endozoicomonas lisbonensis TaxID=3120522 RepID=A0ABV2SDS2_9GAMM
MLKILYPNSYLSERAYIHEVLINDFLGLDFEAIPYDFDQYTIQHKSDGYRRKINLPDVFFAKELGLPELPLKNWILPCALIKNSKLSGTTSLPVIFGMNRVENFPSKKAESLFLPIDIFGSCFFMLSRYEEAINHELDSHSRFPASESMAFKAGLLEQPIVDQYVEILWLTIKSLWPDVERKKRTAKIQVTCDVDVPYDTRFSSPLNISRTLAGDILKRKSIASFGTSVLSIFQKLSGSYKDPYDCFNWYMDTCEKNNHKAAFYFIADNPAGRIDGSYSLKNPRIINLLKSIHDRGHEIGLHGSYNSFSSAEQIFKERKLLLDVCYSNNIAAEINGNRQHFLRWDVTKTPDYLDMAGFSYDTTGGYADHPGFRYGTSNTFKMWSWQKKCALNLRQRPLIIMECTVLAERYLNMGYSKKTNDYVNKLKDLSMKFSGEFTFLWHNSNFNNSEDRILFEELLS